jgi:hypothetical protein
MSKTLRKGALILVPGISYLAGVIIEGESKY